MFYGLLKLGHDSAKTRDRQGVVTSRAPCANAALPLIIQIVCCALVACSLTAHAAAHQLKGRQHLVNPGDEWSHLASQLRPGDEVILMPGVHRPAILDGIQGSPERPIIIRSLNSQHAATINAAIGKQSPGNPAPRHGLLLQQIQHVIIQDLHITDAALHGIEASAPATPQIQHDDAAPVPALVLRNVSITRTGPIGRRNAATLTNFNGVAIEQCHFNGWGGSAIELIACSDVTVERCTFQGLEDFSQLHAVQIRAGSQRVRISDCAMTNAGVTAIAIGGSSQPQEFRQPPSPNATAENAPYEASRVRVLANLIRGGHSAVAFIHCDQCSVRNNTIVNPQRWVYLVLDRAESSTLTRRSVFAANLIQWQPGELQHFSHVTKGAPTNGLTLEQNLWWAPDLLRRRSQLGEPAGAGQFPQIMDVDPKLDEHFFPAEPRAQMFGRGPT